MAFITLSNLNRIISKSDTSGINLTGQIYKISINFFSNYEKNSLLAIQELLKNPKKYFNEIYKPAQSIDTYKYVYEGGFPAYHKYKNCINLHSGFLNFEIPKEIKDKGPEKVTEFRTWFSEVHHLLSKPDEFAMMLQARWGIQTNPRAINFENSGTLELDNYSIAELENNIDSILKRAGLFFSSSKKNMEILERFSQMTFIAYQTNPSYVNDTAYSDLEIKNLLLEFDEAFKKPLKKWLIEYYRLKLNPDIQMEGWLLEKLGFRYCFNCQQKEEIEDYVEVDMKLGDWESDMLREAEAAGFDSIAEASFNGLYDTDEEREAAEMEEEIEDYYKEEDRKKYDING
jgi:hypothetical protein